MRAGPVLTVGMGATVAVRWLIPRLSSFHLAHPEIEVRIATGGAGAPMSDDWTCAVLLGDGQWPGYEAERLFSSSLQPVCAPRLAAELRKAADLAGVEPVAAAREVQLPDLLLQRHPLQQRLDLALDLAGLAPGLPGDGLLGERGAGRHDGPATCPATAALLESPAATPLSTKPKP